MKKSELLEILNSIDGDPEIILSKDGGGNGYRPLKMYDDESVFVGNFDGYYGMTFNTTLVAEDVGMEEGEWDKLKKQPRCLVLYP